MNTSIIIGAALASVIAASASAQPRETVSLPDREPSRVTLSSKGVDFTRPSEARAFYARLQSAALKACDSGRDHDLSTYAADRDYAAQALTRTVRELNYTVLTELHDGADTRLAAR